MSPTPSCNFLQIFSFKTFPTIRAALCVTHPHSIATKNSCKSMKINNSFDFGVKYLALMRLSPTNEENVFKPLHLATFFSISTAFRQRKANVSNTFCINLFNLEMTAKTSMYWRFLEEYHNPSTSAERKQLVLAYCLDKYPKKPPLNKVCPPLPRQ